jgi:hypothetical protein
MEYHHTRVSHHASTLAFCDDGIVVENGILLEAGPLRDLEACRQMASVADTTKGGQV